jgi:hypothetical protein
VCAKRLKLVLTAEYEHCIRDSYDILLHVNKCLAVFQSRKSENEGTGFTPKELASICCCHCETHYTASEDTCQQDSNSFVKERLPLCLTLHTRAYGTSAVESEGCWRWSLVCELGPSSWILDSQMTHRPGNWISFRLQVKSRKTPAMLGPKKELTSITGPVVEVSYFYGTQQSRFLPSLSFSLVEWLRLALSKRPNRVGVFVSSPGHWSSDSFQWTYRSRCLPPPHMKTETDQIFETLYFLVI